eukprot:scaffold15215_cov103-Isochrysis_galbana.AAC.7
MPRCVGVHVCTAAPPALGNWSAIRHTCYSIVAVAYMRLPTLLLAACNLHSQPFNYLEVRVRGEDLSMIYGL